MNLAALIRTMREAGVDPNVILDAVEAGLSGTQEVTPLDRKRAYDRERMREIREVARQSHDSRTTSPIPSEEMSPEPPKTQPTLSPSKNPPKGGQKGSAKDRLATVLKPDLAEAVVEHRRKLRKPLTDHAADLLAKRLAGFPDPNGAAELMIEKGWQSIEPDWVRNLPTPATGPPPEEPKRFETREEHLAWWHERMREKAATQ